MKSDGFEIEISYISAEKRMFYFLFLSLVLIVNIIVINSQSFKENTSYSYTGKYVSLISNKPIIKVYDDNGVVKYTTNDTTKKVLTTYECKNDNCKMYDINGSLKEFVIYDGSYKLYNYGTNKSKELSLNNIAYESIKIVNNKLALEYKNKYAIYDITTNKIITDYMYDGVLDRTYDEIEDATYSTYTNQGKYNQVLDIYDINDHVIKHYDYCTKLEESDKLLCSEHVAGEITQEEIDNTLDIVLKQYPTLNNDRLFTIKTAIETVGLPYFWGGGHGSLKNTLEVATSTWGTGSCVVGASGFKSQESGKAYPCGLDCSGFARWVIYETTGIDIMGKGVSVIGGRNKHPDYTAIPEEELLPGDLIMDKDHVTIYLYTNEEGKKISVHASFNHLKVEISNYKKGKEYFRLNIW